jgi:hypothetical protein
LAVNGRWLAVDGGRLAVHPEGRRYRGRYIVNDDPVGNHSAVATVTTIP